MTLMNVFLWVLVFLLLPVCVGWSAISFLSMKRTFAGAYLAGFYVQCALFQLIAVPLIITKTDFRVLVLVTTIVFSVLALFGMIFFIRDGCHGKIRLIRTKPDGADLAVVILMVLGYLFLAYEMAIHQRTNRDDTRFVVSAVDIVRTNRIFLTNPSTGQEITGLWGDFRRDAIAPWSAYVAYLARITDTHATVMAHSVLPQALMLCMASVYWLFAGHFFKEKLFPRCVVVIGVFLIIVFGQHMAVLEDVALWRIWQGKSVIAAVGIPYIYLVFTWIGDQPKGWKRYFLLWVVCLAWCLNSVTGIILGFMICGVFGFIYAIAGRKWSIALKSWIGALICASFYGIYLLKW